MNSGQKTNHPAPKTLLEAFEQIVEAAERSKLSDEFFEKNDKPIQYVCGRLGFSPVQAVLFALLLDKSDERNISLSSIAQYAGCRTIRILQLASELEELEELRYVRIISGRFSQTYRVSKEVVRSLGKNLPYSYQKPPVKDLASFFDGFRKLLDEKYNEEVSYSSLLRQTREMLEEIPGSSLCRRLKTYNLDEDEQILFIYMAYLYVEDNNDEIYFYNIEKLYDDDEMPPWCRRELRDCTSELIKSGLIENAFIEGMARPDAFRLTEKAKTELLEDLNANEIGKSEKALVKYESLAPKKLYFNPAEAAQIKELESLLGEKRLPEVQENLKRNGLRTGFCCLFHGAPGTGKTETVYQIARATKRHILQVDVDKIKSCWVGESEKNIKAIFDRYRSICRNSKNMPILLFNEADAVLGVRMEGVTKAVDKMENSIQNLILQEMEKLEGIMIATTNLTTNLDRAFDRRFLYKIRYERPGSETRAKIWSQMLPGLSKKEAERLASEFDLSGGEIENVVRKLTVSRILSGKEKIDMEHLRALCRQEKRSLTESRQLGFRSAPCGAGD